ncbi:MAG: SLC13 family permease [Lawsonibacter sp.]|nr:SLC13 family permease [Lawsonibacter sp.]
MWEIIRNPVTLSVIVMCVLCLYKLNVILSLLVAAMVAGLSAGMGPGDIMTGIIGGLDGNGTNALAYLLLGTFAAALADTGLATILGQKIASMVKERKWVLLLTFVLCACISGTIIPIHIAYIPILYPPLLMLMNKMKIDRRQAACVTEFGLVAMYISIPIGYGTIFQGIVADNMTANGMPIELMEVWPFTLILGAGMLVGLIGSWWFYRKPREYQDIELAGQQINPEDLHLNRNHIVALIAIAAVLFGQLYFDSMPLGALLGIAIMIIGGAIKLRNSDGTIAEGIRLMGMISFVMLIAGGYANVVRNTGAVDSLIDATLAILGNSKAIFLIVLILIGLLITMGIGTSFGTIPVIALLYVPMCQKMGISVGATACLIACAAVLGDAGSPASDSTLGPTAGLNADGQHDHIWDTCVPTFLFYNIPLAVAGFFGAMIL